MSSMNTRELFEHYESDQNLVLTVDVYACQAHLRRIVSEHPWRQTADWVRQALLECALIKARALINFLCGGSNPQASDFTAAQLLPDWHLDREKFTEINVIINKHVAHFTTQRFIEGDPNRAASWDEIRDQLDAVLEAFLDFDAALAVHNSKLHQVVSEQVQYLYR